jgi:chromosome condensin MukBEF ATPase and DNA-binding subunit MukB
MFALTKFCGIAISEVFDNICMETPGYLSHIYLLHG